MNASHEHADFDEAWVERDALVVRGRAPEGATLRLAVRRYKSAPTWAVVEVVHDTPTAAADGLVEFRLSCSLDGLGATSGICVAGRRHRCLIPVAAGDPPSSS